MAGTHLVRRAIVLLMTVTSLAAVGVGVSPPASAESITITWPEITAFNPDNTDYVIDVEYDGEGYLYLSGNDIERGGFGFYESVRPNETHTVGFPRPIASTDFHVGIQVCPTQEPFGYRCRHVAISPKLTIYSTFVTRVSAPADIGPRTGVAVWIQQPLPDGVVDVAWAVHAESDPDGTPLIAGTEEDVALVRPEDGDPYVFSTREWRGLLPRHTPLRLSVTVAGEAEPFGGMDGSAWMRFEWDPVNVASLHLSADYGHYKTGVDTFYPVDDGLGDDLIIGVRDEDFSAVTWEVADSAGQVVYSRTLTYRPGSTPSTSWHGRDESRALLPEGRYKVTVRTKDLAGNERVLEDYVRLSHAELDRSWWRATRTAEGTLVSERVGECGSIQRPARPEWPGSLGLYTEKRCPGDGRPLVRTIHRIELPPSPYFYPDAALVVRGASAPGAPSALHLRIRQPAPAAPTRWGEWHTMDNDSGPLEVDAPVLGNGQRDPRLVLEAVTKRGQRFDLRNFSVEIEYVAFVD